MYSLFCCCFRCYDNSAYAALLPVPALASDPPADICRPFSVPDDSVLLLLVRPNVRTLLGRGAEKAHDDRGRLSESDRQRSADQLQLDRMLQIRRLRSP